MPQLLAYADDVNLFLFLFVNVVAKYLNCDTFSNDMFESTLIQDEIKRRLSSGNACYTIQYKTLCLLVCCQTI
jgi:hypothetical protein